MRCTMTVFALDQYDLLSPYIQSSDSNRPVLYCVGGDNTQMNNEFFKDRREASVRRMGLLIAAGGLLALLALAAYRLPLFQHEHHGTIVGISEVHDESGSELMAAVNLDTGEQVLVAMPKAMLNSESNNVRVNERRTLSGSKSYRIVTYDE